MSRIDKVNKQIVYVLDHFPVLSQTFVANEINDLQRRGLLVTVVALRGGQSDRGVRADLVLQEHMLRTILAHARMLIRHPREYFKLFRSALKLEKQFRMWCIYLPILREVLESHHGAYVHTHFALRSATLLSLISSTMKLNWGVTTHAFDIFVENGRLRERLAGAKVLTISEYNRTFLAALGVDVTRVYYCGVDPTSVKPRALIAEVAARNILFVGRLVQKKGVETLLNALEILNADADADAEGRGAVFEASIIGDGALKEELTDRIDRQNLVSAVTMYGSADHDTVLELLAKRPIVVVPSVVADNGDKDGLPVIILEALLNACPVIASDLAGIREVVSSETGWLCPPGDAAALADTIRRVAADVRAADARANAGRALVLATRTIAQQAEAIVDVANMEVARESS